MAQRFGGKYSPDGSGDTSSETGGDTGVKTGLHAAASQSRPARAGARLNLLFIAPLPLVFSMFGEGATSLAVHLCALGVLLLSAWLTRDGVAAHEAFDARKIAKRPAIPRKLFGSVLMGAGLFLASVLTSGLIGGVIVGVAGAALHFGAFGMDPLRSKGAEGVDQFQQDRVARVVAEAEAQLTTMSRHIDALGDRTLEARVNSFQNTARTMFRTVEEDPRDLAPARKFLGVYLKGATEASVKYADLVGKRPDGQARTSYIAFLDDLETTFAAKTSKLLDDNRSDMDIEIKVLRDRLAREGLSTD